jgi:hypothetical protein
MSDWKFDVSSIHCVNIEGPQRFEYIDNRTAWTYLEQRRRWAAEGGVSLPHYEVLHRFGPLEDLRILCRRLNIFIRFKDTSWVDFTYFPGFITDLASVPTWFRGCVDNDTASMVPAVLVHDYLFSAHALPFEYTNELFYQLLLSCGYNRTKACIARWAVSSVFGRRAWRLNKDRREVWTKKTASMLLPRPIEVDGKTYKGSFRDG